MRFYVKMVNGKLKKVKLISADSQESIEMEEYSDEDDEVFVRNNRNGEAGDAARRPLMKKKKVSICQTIKYHNFIQIPILMFKKEHKKKLTKTFQTNKKQSQSIQND